jgi:rRNA maturation endonuclease Nob1
MPLIRRLRSVLNRGSDARSYTYQCLLCNEQFVTEESHMAEVSCPGCGASNVRSVVDGA